MRREHACIALLARPHFPAERADDRCAGCPPRYGPPRGARCIQGCTDALESRVARSLADVNQQLSIFGHQEPRFDSAFARLTRTELGDAAWFDYQPAWLEGHEQLFDALRQTVHWRSEQRQMYDRVVAVPRLYAELPRDGVMGSILEAARESISARYGQSLSQISLGYYRDGSDSVAWHGDYVARELPEALVATISVGAPRPLLIRPKGGGRSTSLCLGWGDLLVMGGTCQRTFEHAIPKRKFALPRIVIMFRPQWGRSEQR